VLPHQLRLVELILCLVPKHMYNNSNSSSIISSPLPRNTTLLPLRPAHLAKPAEQGTAELLVVPAVVVTPAETQVAVAGVLAIVAQPSHQRL
jgi:hypothetical protein